MKIKFLIFVFLAFFAAQSPALAATFPVSSVDIFAKSIASSQVVSGRTDNDGNFNITVKEENGAYNIFIGDENTTPIKISAQKSIVSGRIVIMTDGTTTKDPAPDVSIPVKKSDPAPAKKPAPATKSAPAKKPAPAAKTIKTKADTSKVLSI